MKTLRHRLALPGIAALPPLLFSCASSTAWNFDDGLAADSIELQVGADGGTREIEYHVPATAVPAAVLDAMDRLYPAGTAAGAEKEYVRGTLYWEVKKQIGGLAVEAMFRPDGTLHSEEIEVAAEKVPQAVRDALAGRYEGELKSWEEVRDAQRAVVEYHAKLRRDGRDYKVLLSPTGQHLGAFREVVAEIELPLR